MIYIFLILIPLVIINYTAIENIKQSTFRDIEVDSLKTANIIGDLSRNNMDNLVNLKRIVKQYSSASGKEPSYWTRTPVYWQTVFIPWKMKLSIIMK